MDDGFELLEQKVHKAAARLRELAGERDGLRTETAVLRAETETLKARLRKAEEEVHAAAARADKAERELPSGAARSADTSELRTRAEKAERELLALRQDREELRKRVARMLELLESLG